MTPQVVVKGVHGVAASSIQTSYGGKELLAGLLDFGIDA